MSLIDSRTVVERPFTSPVIGIVQQRDCIVNLLAQPLNLGAKIDDYACSLVYLNKTSITSTKGVTLISDIADLFLPFILKVMCRSSQSPGLAPDVGVFSSVFCLNKYAQ